MRSAAAALAVLVALAGVARADDTDPLAEAAGRYDRGVDLSKRGDDLGALAEFQAAYQLSGSWEVLFNIGITERKLFRYGHAIHTLERYLADGGDQVDAKRRADVQAELVAMRKLVAELTVVVDGDPARVEVDGLDEGTSPLAEPLLVAPGPHTVRATRDGELPDEKSVEVVSGEQAEVRLAPHPAPVAPTTATLTLRTVPAGGTLRFDNRAVGTSPWSAEVPAGEHSVVAELAGYHRLSRDVAVVGGQDRDVALELTALPPPPPPLYRRPWVWGTAGGVVVAAVATVLIVSSLPETPDVVVHWPQ